MSFSTCFKEMIFKRIRNNCSAFLFKPFTISKNWQVFQTVMLKLRTTVAVSFGKVVQQEARVDDCKGFETANTNSE